MEGWLLDSAIAVICLVVFIAGLLILPALLPVAYAYIVAIGFFIIIMSAAGHRILENTH